MSLANITDRALRPIAIAGLAFVLIAAAVSVRAAENLGRLFFTPQQRQDLDYRRQANIRDAEVTQGNEVTANGSVSRSSGKTTIWINGMPQDDVRATRDPARVRIPGTEGRNSTDIKVGQTLDRSQGKIKEEIGGGLIVTPGGQSR